MRIMLKKFAFLIALFTSCVFTFAQEAPKAPAAKTPATKPAAVDPGKPTDSIAKRGERAGKFMEMHESFLARIKSGKPIDVLFMGDSITAGWSTRGKALFAQKYEPMNAANF